MIDGRNLRRARLGAARRHVGVVVPGQDLTHSIQVFDCGETVAKLVKVVHVYLSMGRCHDKSSQFPVVSRLPLMYAWIGTRQERSGGVMRPIALALAALLVGLSLAHVSAQSPAPAAPQLSLSPASAGLDAARVVQGQGFPANVQLLGILIDPGGGEIVLRPYTDGTGSFQMALTPGPSGWSAGLYRVAMGLADGAAVSATFTASDGSPHLFAEPNLPSPTSAFIFVGTGLPPNTEMGPQVALAGGNLGSRELHVTTDANGSFSTYLWPDEAGTPFFPTGAYQVALPAYGLQATFWVREHPDSATISLPGTVQVGESTPLQFTHYTAHRMLWGVYAGRDGKAGGEFLIGPTDAAGDISTALTIPDLGPGPYYIATPYDWGEASFAVVEPTATPTATATATNTPLPTATRRPRRTATPTPRATHRPKPTATRTASKTSCKKGRNKRGRRCKR